MISAAARRLLGVSPVIFGADAASPQPTVPSEPSRRMRRFSACEIVTPAIFIGCLRGTAIRNASRRLMRTGLAPTDSSAGLSFASWATMIVLPPADLHRRGRGCAEMLLGHG